ncbi:MAG: hypothetical protein HY078_14510 [Elusimicrobia bacterium]|nr:hypothetical protein [Elusimicrobiota bacterium]
MAIFEKATAKVQKGWSIWKKMFSWMCIWGLIFSLVTIGRLRVGFDYDDTLVFSTPAFNKAFKSGVQAFSPEFWSIVNQSYDLERPKYFTNAFAWFFRLLGFRITVIAARPPEGGDPLKKEWRHLVHGADFQFVPDAEKKPSILRQGNYILYFGDSDSDIVVARRAGIFPLRVRRSVQSSNKDEYHPGTMGELTIPLSQF